MSKFASLLIGGALVVAMPVIASAKTSIQYLGSVLPTDLSADGSVVVGNLPGSFETFRWTQATGVVPLGRATVPTLGIGSGSPDVSSDGTKVSATILSDSGTQSTWGKWTLGTGWQQIAPFPANASPSGADQGGAWGLSGDGNKVVGLYWITGGRAHAGVGTAQDGVTDLGAVTNRSSRANAANYDGSVVGGWDGNAAGFPGRNPTVWVNGVKTSLGDPTVDSEVSSVNADGTIVGGNLRGPADPVRQAAIWRFTGGSWVRQDLGVLPGTEPDMTGAIVDDMSADGSIAVGFNRFNNFNFNDATGFYWSAETGMISANQLISNLGLTLPSPFQILELTSVSPDGSTIAGIGVDANGYQGFLISVPEPGSLGLFGLALPWLAMRRNRSARQQNNTTANGRNAMKVAKSLAVLTAAISVVSATNAIAGMPLEKVIKNTDTVPGIAGAAWATSSPFVASSIDASGQVAFRASMQSGVGGVTASDNTTGWYGAPAGLTLFARTGNPGPGLAGVNVTAFSAQNVGISANGNLFFSGSTAAPNGYIATGSVAGGFSKVARNGDVLPGVGGVSINSNPGPNLLYYFVNNAGQTLLYSSLTGNASAALWVGNSAHLQLAYQTGQSYTGLPTGTTVKNLQGASMINGSGSLYASVLMNNAAGITGANNEVLATLPFGSSTYNVVVREGDVAPSCGGATYAKVLFDSGLGFEGVALNSGNGNFNNAGHALYSSILEGTGVVAGANDAAMFYHDGTSAQLLRRRGDATTAVPGAVLAVSDFSATNARLNNNDSVAWTSSLVTGTGGVTSSNDATVLKTQLGSASDTLIAREGSSVSTVPGALFGSSFSSLMQNNAGQIVFSTTMVDDPTNPNDNVTTSNDLAMFAWDPNMGLGLVAREGESLASIGVNMTLTGSWLSINANPNTEGGANALSDNGWLTFRATGTALAGFTDTSAIVRTQIPEPGSAMLLLGSGLLAARRRRRVFH